MKLRRAKAVKLSRDEAIQVSIYLEACRHNDLVNPLLLSDFRKLEDDLDTQIWGKEYVNNRNVRIPNNNLDILYPENPCSCVECD